MNSNSLTFAQWELLQRCRWITTSASVIDPQRTHANELHVLEGDKVLKSAITSDAHTNNIMLIMQSVKVWVSLCFCCSTVHTYLYKTYNISISDKIPNIVP